MTNRQLTFIETDNGNCRVYYRNGRHIRCFQEDEPGKFNYYICSRDGEPEYTGKIPFPLNRLPADDSATSRSFRDWRNSTATLV